MNFPSILIAVPQFYHYVEFKKGNGAHEPKTKTAGAYPGFLGMKHA